MNPQRLAGRVSVVTGAGGGIGRALVSALAIEGATVCAVGRNAAALDDLAAAVRSSGGQVRPCIADLSVQEQIVALASDLTGEFPRLDALIHCAGMIAEAPLRDASIQSFDAQFGVNARAPYLFTQALLPLLKAGRGDIVFINSSAGLTAKRPGISQYAATKHALRAIADSLREEINAEGIRVLSLYLGRTATPMQEDLHRRQGKPYRPALLLQPEDVAATIVHALLLPRTAEITDIRIRPMNKT